MSRATVITPETLTLYDCFPSINLMTTTTNNVYAAPTGSLSIQSFLITSDTTAELNWQPPPPLEQNGVIVDYSIELCSNRTHNCSRWNTGSNDTFYNLKGECTGQSFLQEF